MKYLVASEDAGLDPDAAARVLRWGVDQAHVHCVHLTFRVQGLAVGVICFMFEGLCHVCWVSGLGIRTGGGLIRLTFTVYTCCAGGASGVRFHVSWLFRKVNVRLLGKGNSNSHGARPVHQIISVTKWIRTSRLPIKNSLSRVDVVWFRFWGLGLMVWDKGCKG